MDPNGTRSHSGGDGGASGARAGWFRGPALTPAPNARRTVSLGVAVVIVGLLVASWVITSDLRHRAATASERVEAVTAATAQLSKLENTEAAFFTGSTTSAQVNFPRLLANVLTSAHAINDMAANYLLASYVDQADRVVRLITDNDVAQAAYVEQAGQVPAGDLLIGAYNRFAAAQARSATSTEASAADLSQAVQWGALALVALALLAFWWLDSRTERERARAVERTEARYRGIVARGSDALFLVDATGAVTFASESVRAVLGRDVDDSARPAFASLFPDDEAAGLDAALAAARADPEHPASVPVTLDDPDKRYLEVVVNDRLDDPSIGAVVVSARDLTDRKAAESALARSEALTQDLIDHTPVLVYVKDLSGRYQRVNKAWAQAMGKSVAQTLGKRVDEVFSPETARALSAADEAVVSRGAYEAEFELDVDGRSKTFLTSRFPLVDASGQVYAVGGVSIDITDRAREVDLERTLGSMMSRSGDAIFTTAGGDITFVNRAAEELTGFSALELIGAQPTIFAAPGHEVEQARLWTAVRRGDTIQGAATSIKTKSGGVIPVEVTLTPQRDAEGASRRRVGDRARRHRAPARERGAGPRRAHRRADRPAQPDRPPAPPGARGPARAPRRRGRRADVLRPRPLQGGQRPIRHPRRGQRHASGDGRAGSRRAAPDRLRRAPARRRVRGRLLPGRRPGPRRGDRASRGRRGRRAGGLPGPRALLERVGRGGAQLGGHAPRPGWPRATPRCTRPSARAGTGSSSGRRGWRC